MHSSFTSTRLLLAGGASSCWASQLVAQCLRPRLSRAPTGPPSSCCLKKSMATQWAQTSTCSSNVAWPPHAHENGRGSHGLNGSSGKSIFSGSTTPELQHWLETHGVDTSCYGKGMAKTVDELLEEQARLESVLSLESGRPLRTVRVLSLHILNNKGQVLFEDEQILPDGRSRKRQVAVSEKLVGEESWRNAVDRAILEELSVALPSGYQVEVLDHTYRRLEELSTSMSYPGLITRYVFHRVSALLPGLPEGPFETTEPRPGGHLTTRWVWKDLGVVEQLECAPTSSTG